MDYLFSLSTLSQAKERNTFSGSGPGRICPFGFVGGGHGKETEAGACGRNPPRGFLETLLCSHDKLAFELRVPVTRIADIVAERRGITPDTALRLARYFRTTPQFWGGVKAATAAGWSSRRRGDRWVCVLKNLRPDGDRNGCGLRRAASRDRHPDY